MSDPGDQSTLPPDFGQFPNGPPAPSVPPPAPPPVSPPARDDAGLRSPPSFSPGIADEHRAAPDAVRAGWSDQPGAQPPPLPPPGLGADAPPTNPPETCTCTACGSRFVTTTTDPVCPACRRILGGLPSGAAAQPFEIKELKCASCGYDLTGLRSDADCAECGTPVVRSLPAWTVGAAQPFPVRGFQCLNCGYDLTGLSSDGACPECGVAIDRSLKGNLLRFASVEYVGTLRTGVLLAEVGAVAGLCVSLVSIAFPFVTPAMGARGVALIEASLTVGASGLGYLGWWLFSTPDPARIGKDEAMGARKLLRVALPVEFVLSITKFASVFLPAATTPLMFGGAVTGNGPPWAIVLGIAGVLLGTGAFMLRFFSSMLYLRSVARRVPDVRLHKSATRFMWLGPVLVLSSVVTCFLGYLAAYVVYLIILERTRSLLQHTLDAMKATVPAR